MSSFLMGPRDVWAWQLAGELDVDLDYDNTTYSVTTDTFGSWACGLMAASGTLPGPWVSVYTELVGALNALGHTGTFEIDWATPSGSTLTNGGIQIEDTSGSGVQWTLTPKNDRTSAALGVLSGAATSDASGVYVSDVSSGVVWQPHTIHAQYPARAKDRDEERYLVEAGDDVRYAPSIEFGDPLVTRRFEYRMIPAAHVEKRAADDATAAQVGGLTQGDIYNTYYRLWDRLSRRRRVIVQHGAEGAWSPSGVPTEWGRLESQDARKMSRSAITRSDEDDRYYDIDLTLAIEGDDGV